MIRFIIDHATDFEKASQSLFSLLRFIEQCEDEYGYIDTNVAMPISEVITSLCSSSQPLKTSWDEYIQLEAGKMVASIQQDSADWDTYCDDIKKLRHSHFTFDSYVYHAYLKQLYTSIQESIERNDTMDTSSLMTLTATSELVGYSRVSFAFAGENVNELAICYQFAGVGYRRMNVIIPVLKVNAVYNGEHVLGSVYINNQHTFSVDGYHIASYDKMKFVDRNGQAEYSCTASGDALHGQSAVTMMMNEQGRTEGDFLFTIPGLNLAMCYYFNEYGVYVLYPTIQVDV